MIRLFAHWTAKVYTYRFYFAYATNDDPDEVNKIAASSIYTNYDLTHYIDVEVSYDETLTLLTFEDFASKILIDYGINVTVPEHYRAYAWFRWYNNYDNASESSDSNPDYTLNYEDWYVDRGYYNSIAKDSNWYDPNFANADLSVLIDETCNSNVQSMAISGLNLADYESFYYDEVTRTYKNSSFKYFI